MDFMYPVYIPSIDDHVGFRELKNKHYSVILKYIANEDNINLVKYYDKLIDHLCDDIKSCDLNKIDKFCALMSLRITCISPEITLELKCAKTDNKYSGVVDLYKVLQLASDLYVTKDRVVKLANNVKITLGMPSSLFYDNVSSAIDVVADTVKYVDVDNNRYNLTDMSLAEKNAVIDHLPGGNFKKVLEYANRIQAKYNEFVVFKDKNPHDDEAEIKEYKIGLYDNSMYDMLRLCYDTFIGNYYMSMYTLCDTMGFSGEYIENITPAESNIYIQQKRQEVEKQKAQQASQTQSPTVGNAVPHGNLP